MRHRKTASIGFDEGSQSRVSAIAAAGLLCALAWAYWGTFGDLFRKWNADPQYSHGYLVPVFAIGLLWFRRDKLPTAWLRPNPAGLLLLGAALVLRHASIHFYAEWLEQISLVACVPGIVLTVGGWAALRWAWPACLFLVFMLPLPYGLEVLLRDPLRRAGTLASTYAMQTIGLQAYSEGNVIVVDDQRIEVVEACSGLSMLMIFFALSTAVAMVGDQPLWRRFVLVLCATPIALIANMVRITATGSLHVLGYHWLAHEVFHDRLAGPVMMGLALAMLGLVWALLDRLIIVESDEPVAMPSLFRDGDRRSQRPPCAPTHARPMPSVLNVADNRTRT